MILKHQTSAIACCFGQYPVPHVILPTQSVSLAMPSVAVTFNVALVLHANLTLFQLPTLSLW